MINALTVRFAVPGYIGLYGMNRKRIKEYDLIMFDVGGVLIDYDEEKHYGRMAHLLGLKREPFFKKAFALARSLERREITVGMAERLICKEFGTRFSTVRGLWATSFKESVAVRSDMLQLVNRLFIANHKIAITPNTNVSDYRILYGKAGLLRELRRYPIFASCYVGLAKPDLNYYRLVVKRMKSTFESAILVDDKPTNISSAKKLGIKSIHFRNRNQLQGDLAGLQVGF